jgi:DNA-binding MarR family transcriptional regulator
MAVAVVTPPRSTGHEAFIEAWRRFSRASQRVKARRRCGERDGGLSLPQALLLSGLLHEPELTVGALADLAMVAKPTATRMLDTLERDGLVVRRKCVRDRRAVLVSLTDEGRAVLDASWTDLHAGLQRASEKLTEQERGEATSLLHRLAQLMDEI